MTLRDVLGQAPTQGFADRASDATLLLDDDSSVSASSRSGRSLLKLDETRKRCALHGSLGTAYARFLRCRG
jgi:hypothetical protein